MDQYRVFRMPDARPGAGRPTFLLLHGLGLSHRSFTPVARILAGHGDVIALDLPGFGASRLPGSILTVEDCAEGVARVLDRADHAGPLIAVGHSMGAQFALELALTRPDLVTGVVMIGPVADPRRRTVRQHMVRLARDAAREPLRTNLMVLFDYFRCGPVWVLAEARAMVAYATDERILRLKQPLLVLRGERDPIALASWTTWLGTRTAGGRAETASRHRHNVVHSSPRDVAERILRFAAGLTAPSDRG